MLASLVSSALVSVMVVVSFVSNPSGLSPDVSRVDSSGPVMAVPLHLHS